jgi:ABC-type phosphate transport system substrate-binding protein
MRTPRLLLVVLLLSAATFAGTAPVVAPQGPPGPPLAIIVHRSNPVDNLTFRELRRIFMLDTQSWPQGRRITVVLRDYGQPERADAIRMVCGLSESDYAKHILLRMFQGSVSIGPRAIQSVSGMLNFVYSAPGAIGYVNAGEVAPSVKLLRIDGMLPDDPRYPLRRRAGGRGADER